MIDSVEIARMPDQSVTDPETIRQIALHGIETGDSSLNSKVKKGFEVFGLYPHLIKSHDIYPDETPAVHKELLRKLSLMRKSENKF